jgi:hypothetical protein
MTLVESLRAAPVADTTRNRGEIHLPMRLTPPRHRSRAALSLAAALAVTLTGCSELDFFGKGPAQRASDPMVIQGFVLHRYQGEDEELRIHGDEARYYRDQWGGPLARVEVSGVRVFFYDKEPPVSQIGRLRSTTATIYLREDSATTPSFGKHDIDFGGDVVYLDRSKPMRVQTTQMRYHNLEDFLDSDALTTTVVLMNDGVFQEIGNEGFELRLGDRVDLWGASGQSQGVTGPRGLQLRDALRQELLAVGWVRGPDDQPASPFDFEPALTTETLRTGNQTDAPTAGH